MKHILFALIFAVQSLLGAQALAAPCTMSTLTAYLGLGSAGCTIGRSPFFQFPLVATTHQFRPFQRRERHTCSGLNDGGRFGLQRQRQCRCR